MRALDLEFHESMSNFLETERPTGQVGRDISPGSPSKSLVLISAMIPAHILRRKFFFTKEEPRHMRIGLSGS